MFKTSSNVVGFWYGGILHCSFCFQSNGGISPDSEILADDIEGYLGGRCEICHLPLNWFIRSTKNYRATAHKPGLDCRIKEQPTNEEEARQRELTLARLILSSAQKKWNKNRSLWKLVSQVVNPAPE